MYREKNKYLENYGKLNLDELIKLDMENLNQKIEDKERKTDSETQEDGD